MGVRPQEKNFQVGRKIPNVPWSFCDNRQTGESKPEMLQLAFAPICKVEVICPEYMQVAGGVERQAARYTYIRTHAIG